MVTAGNNTATNGNKPLQPVDSKRQQKFRQQITATNWQQAATNLPKPFILNGNNLLPI
jgi:hypothetical protein